MNVANGNSRVTTRKKKKTIKMGKCSLNNPKSAERRREEKKMTIV
jgi:hypothetical protein